MDVTVTPGGKGEAWQLTDLLGRSMGVIKVSAPGQYMIEPAGGAVVTMKGILEGPYKSLDDALTAIETHTRGVCRLVPV